LHYRDKFFRHKSLLAKLMSSEHRCLVNTNDFQEKYWGHCCGTGATGATGAGQNMLGKLLEQVRLQSEKGHLRELWLRDHFTLEDPEKVTISITVRKGGSEVVELAQVEERKVLLEVGKSDDNDVLLDHPTASRFHALLVVDRTRGLVLLDLRAANGTRVDGHPIQPMIPVALTSSSTVKFAVSE
jgi:hypothetical protein